MVHNPTFVALSDWLQTLHSAVGNNTKALSDSLAFEIASIEWSKSHLAEVRIPIVRVCIVGSNACWLAYTTYR